MPSAVLNLLGTAAVFLCFVGLLAIAPDTHKKETELRCDASGIARSVFPSMDACVEETRRIRACGCHRVPNEWATWYAFGVTPVVPTVMGYLLLTGTLLLRLLLLNIGVGSAVLANFAWALAVDPAAGMIVPLIPAFVAAFCAGVSVLFLAIHFARRMISHEKGAT